MCEIPWYIKIPMNPTYSSDISETQHLGIIGIAVNGVPFYGAKEGTGDNAVETDDDGAIKVPWAGHASPENDWHYHNPRIPVGGSGSDYYPSNDTLVGYALDGFKIYGPLDDDSVLDECNGWYIDDETYQYHLRTEEQIDDSADYCNSDGSNNWVGQTHSCLSYPPAHPPTHTPTQLQTHHHPFPTPAKELHFGLLSRLSRRHRGRVIHGLRPGGLHLRRHWEHG